MSGYSMLTLAVSALTLLYVADRALGCNEAVCASLVSKCMLLRSCECNMLDKDNCTCCKDCHRCLDKLYTECCACVGLCAESSSKDSLYKTSSVEELADPIPGLFRVLTEEEDPHLRWTSYSYPAHLDLLYFKPPGGDNFEFASNLGAGEGARVQYGPHQVVLEPNSGVQNCTVAYMSQCMSLNKCKVSCLSMGAARYRWFHDYGCCECVGSTCLQYGKPEALCLKCPVEDEQSMTDEDEEDDDFAYVDSEGEGKKYASEEDGMDPAKAMAEMEQTQDFIMSDGGKSP